MRTITQINDNWTLQETGGCFEPSCTCTRTLTVKKPADGSRVYLEFRGMAQPAEVFLNGESLCRHEAGDAVFRADLTDHLTGSDTLAVTVEGDTACRNGGLWGDVCLVTEAAAHAAPDGQSLPDTPGLRVTPIVKGCTADVAVAAYVTGEGCAVTFELAGKQHRAPVENGCAMTVFHLDPVRLWDDLKNPYLYTVTARLKNGEVISARFGCRAARADR